MTPEQGIFMAFFTFVVVCVVLMYCITHQEG
jgi:hypothetical protein